MLKKKLGGMELKIENIVLAARKLKPIVSHTPLQLNVNLSQEYEANIFLKREDLQLVRSYKLRGAYHLISSLTSSQISKGVVCASAGNHAQGVAFSCAKLKCKGVIFMPTTAPQQKVNQVKMFGGEYVEVKLYGDTFDDAKNAALTYCNETGTTFIHPFDDEKIMEGQATVGVEILDVMEGEIDFLFVPIGGGGLVSGVASYFDSQSPSTKIIGVEPQGAASMHQSILNNKVTTLKEIDPFVDGAAVKEVGVKNFDISKRLIDDIIVVPEGKICSTIVQLYNKEAIVAEPAGALTIAALDDYRGKIKGKNVVCVVSGGNNDLQRMPEIKERSLLYEGLKHYFIIRFPQRSGALLQFVKDVLGPNDDITRFEYAKKSAKESGPALVGIELKYKYDFQTLVENMERAGVSYTHLNNDPNLFEYFV